MKISSKNILKYLIIIVIISTTISFGIKYLGTFQMLPWNLAYNDVGGWYKKASEPGLPYIDKLVEYPVITGMFIHLSSRSTAQLYMFLHYFVFLICAVITTIYLYKLSESLNTDKKFLFIFWALSPGLLWFVYYNWDIIVVMFSTMALYYFNEKKDITGGILLGLGFAAKMYPIVFLLPILLHRKFIDWIKISVAVFGTFFLVNSYFIFTKFEGWLYTYFFHSIREPNIDTIWHLIQIVFPDLTVNMINMITLFLFAGIYVYMNLSLMKSHFIKTAFLSVLIFLIINKVFSPQFILWLLPFFAIYGLNLKQFYLLEGSNLAVLFTTIPHIFSGKEFTFWLVLSGLFVALRHVTLFILAIRLGKKLTHRK